MSDVWMVVPTAPEYEVSDDGFVRRDGRILKPYMRGRAGSGYPSINTYSGGIATHRTVHSMIAEAFLGPPGRLQVNHKDGVKTNNSASNLEYVTAKENIGHATEIGLRRFRGERGPNARLTASQVAEIRRGTDATRAAAKRYGVSQSTISQIRRGVARRWDVCA